MSYEVLKLILEDCKEMSKVQKDVVKFCSVIWLTSVVAENGSEKIPEESLKTEENTNPRFLEIFNLVQQVKNYLV